MSESYRARIIATPTVATTNTGPGVAERAVGAAIAGTSAVAGLVAGAAVVTTIAGAKATLAIGRGATAVGHALVDSLEERDTRLGRSATLGGSATTLRRLPLNFRGHTLEVFRAAVATRFPGSGCDGQLQLAAGGAVYLDSVAANVEHGFLFGVCEDGAGGLEAYCRGTAGFAALQSAAIDTVQQLAAAVLGAQGYAASWDPRRRKVLYQRTHTTGARAGDTETIELGLDRVTGALTIETRTVTVGNRVKTGRECPEIEALFAVFRDMPSITPLAVSAAGGGSPLDGGGTARAAPPSANEDVRHGAGS